MDYHLLIHKYLSGEISDEEKEKLDSWLDLHPENRELYEDLKLIWDNADLSEIELDYDPEEELRAIHERINRASIDKRVEQKQDPIKLKISRFLKIAAVILLLITSNLLVWFLTKPSDDNIIRIANGQHYNEILLPDSSMVYLNKNTSFSFQQVSGKREAYLKGEAFFEVSKDLNKPFFVHLQNASVKVLGTSFNVKAYPAKDSTEVIVTFGTVEVYNDLDSLKLDQGEKASFHRHQQDISKSINTNPNFNAWLTGKLQFSNTDLESILAILEDYYEVSFKVKNNKLLACRFTGTFENDKLEKVLKVLSFGLNVEFQYQKGQYLITGKGCEKNP